MGYEERQEAGDEYMAERAREAVRSGEYNDDIANSIYDGDYNDTIINMIEEGKFDDAIQMRLYKMIMAQSPSLSIIISTPSKNGTILRQAKELGVSVEKLEAIKKILESGE